MSFEGKIKKKKKKSYLSKAKKFGKSGRFGKGSYVSEDVYNYFVRVVELDNAGFASDEERDVFVSNTFEQTVGQEVLLSTNQFTSVALERLIKKGKDECVLKFMKSLAEDMRPILNDCFASHVFQTCLKKAAQRIQEIPADEDSKSKEEYTSWIIKVGRFLSNNMEDFMWDQYANQIMRTVAETSSGSEPSNAKEAKTKKKLPKILREFFKEFCLHVQNMPQLPDMVSAVITSGFLQTLLKCSSLVSAKLFKPLAAKLVSALDNKKSSDRMEGPCWRLLEAILATKDEEINQQMYEKFFKGSLKKTATDSEKNFSVQRLLENCPSKEQLEAILEELNTVEVIESLLSSGNFGVIRAMGESCKNLATNQGSFCQSLIGALHCNNPNDRMNLLSPLILAMKDFEKYEHFRMMNEDAVQPVTLQGSLLLQACLNFNKPIKFVQSFLSLDGESLVQILSEPKGCHVTDAFMGSKFIGEKSREKLCHILKGHWAILGCSKFGSRSLDSIWKVSTLKMRQSIMNELSKELPKLKGDQYGRFIVTNYGLELFKHHPEDWATAQGKEITAKKLFSDILGEDEPATKKIKKN